MAIRIGDEPERISRLEKLAPWIRRIVMFGCLVWAMYSIQIPSEDVVSHTIKISYPLLLGHERITAPQPGFDPAKARWEWIRTAVPIVDGQIVFVRTGTVIYAVRISQQQSQPDTGLYEYLKVGDAAPIVKAFLDRSSDHIVLPSCSIAWSGHVRGQGYISLDDAFIQGQAARFEIGVPLQSGDLEKFRRAVPANIHFESLPWKLKSGDEEIIPAQ